MKTLVIGGTGLISTPMVRQLVEAGHEVTLVNRSRTPSRIGADVRVLPMDRRDFASFEGLVRETGPWDCVIDMVCFRPDEAFSLVRACDGIAPHLIFCSTVDVYTKPPVAYPIREDAPQTTPLGEYATNKSACERLLREAEAQGKFTVTITRPAQTYGEGGSIIHSLGWSTTYLDRIRKGKPIVVHGDGTSLWTATHIDDVARAFVGAVGNPKSYGMDYNLTGDEVFAWNDYHRIVARALGAPEPELVHIPGDLLADLVPDRAGVVKVNFKFSNVFDNSAAKRDLGFKQTILFERGVQRTVAWLDANGRVEDSDLDDTDDRLIADWRAMANELRSRWSR